MGICQEHVQMPSSSNTLTGWPRTVQNLPSHKQKSSPVTVSVNILTFTVLNVLSVSFSTVNMENWALNISNLCQKSFKREAALKLTSNPLFRGRVTIQLKSVGLKCKVFWISFLEKSSHDIPRSFPSTYLNKNHMLWCLCTSSRHGGGTYSLKGLKNYNNYSNK